MSSITKKLSHLKRKKKRNFELLYNLIVDIEVDFYMNAIENKKVTIYDEDYSYEEEITNEEINLYLTFIKIYLDSTKNRDKEWEEINKFYKKYKKLYKIT